MPLPGPVAVARRLGGVLVSRPRATLRPFLRESYSERPTLFEEAMTLTSGVGAFVIVSLGALLATALAAGYALAYPVLRRLVALAAAVRERLRR